MTVEYALYRGDEFLDIGTIKELSKRYNISVKTLRWYSTPCYKNKIKNKNKSDIDIIMAECPSDYGIKNNKDNEGYKDCSSCIKCWNRPYSK